MAYQKLLEKPYVHFVEKLARDANEPSTLGMIRGGLTDYDSEDDILHYDERIIAVQNLRPTQTEVDVDKSLAYALEINPGTIENYFKDVVVIKAPIVTFSNGDPSGYLMDGHHRWSQVFVFNPLAEMAAMNLRKERLSPLTALKANQLAIAANIGEVPQATVEGQNLFTISKSDLEKYVKNKVCCLPAEATHKERKKCVENGPPKGCKGQEVLDNLGKALEQTLNVEELSQYIWGNVEIMRRTSQPYDGSPSRKYMPQTDRVETDDKNWKDIVVPAFVRGGH